MTGILGLVLTAGLFLYECFFTFLFSFLGVFFCSEVTDSPLSSIYSGEEHLDSVDNDEEDLELSRLKNIGSFLHTGCMSSSIRSSICSDVFRLSTVVEHL